MANAPNKRRCICCYDDPFHMGVGCICFHLQTGCCPCLLCAKDPKGLCWGPVCCGSQIDFCCSCRLLLHGICFFNICCSDSCSELTWMRFFCCNPPYELEERMLIRESQRKSERELKEKAKKTDNVPLTSAAASETPAK